ncbi:unnamed protein product [Paramecium sonneborni]|uniref:Superoxide dismutase [Cu-Zn] n=1 Tax=Paramecium sonneborni TaxID=65129 RepID=A0A8S1LTZ2_9CILI|nr:unnamed protein product [Paramecium sonneborni]
MLKSFGIISGFVLLSQGKVNSLTENFNASRHALCILFPDFNSGVNGVVSFSQEHINSKTKIAAVVRGLKPNSLHGIHIHEYGDLSNGCTTAGSHYNPFGHDHGGPLDEKRHIGDLGNIKTDERGNGYLTYEDNQIQLYGEYSILGRSVVVHAGQDDLGRGNQKESKTTGNSGARLACGVIGLASGFKNLQPYK